MKSSKNLSKHTNQLMIKLGVSLVLVLIFGVIYVLITQINWSSLFYEPKNITLIYDNLSEQTLAEFCSAVEQELNYERLGNPIKDWSCVPYYDANISYEDYVYNKTSGVCNCSAVLEGNRYVEVEVRMAPPGNETS